MKRCIPMSINTVWGFDLFDEMTFTQIYFWCKPLILPTEFAYQILIYKAPGNTLTQPIYNTCEVALKLAHSSIVACALNQDYLFFIAEIKKKPCEAKANALVRSRVGIFKCFYGLMLTEKKAYDAECFLCYKKLRGSIPGKLSSTVKKRVKKIKLLNWWLLIGREM